MGFELFYRLLPKVEVHGHEWMKVGRWVGDGELLIGHAGGQEVKLALVKPTLQVVDPSGSKLVAEHVGHGLPLLAGVGHGVTLARLGDGHAGPVAVLDAAKKAHAGVVLAKGEGLVEGCGAGLGCGHGVGSSRVRGMRKGSREVQRPAW